LPAFVRSISLVRRAGFPNHDTARRDAQINAAKNARVTFDEVAVAVLMLVVVDTVA
jgi:hypothetical protein